MQFDLLEADSKGRKGKGLCMVAVMSRLPQDCAASSAQIELSGWF